MPEPVFTQEENQRAVRALQPHSSYDHGRFGAFVGFDHALKLQLELGRARDIIEQYPPMVRSILGRKPVTSVSELEAQALAFLERTAPQHEHPEVAHPGWQSPAVPALKENEDARDSFGNLGGDSNRGTVLDRNCASLGSVSPVAQAVAPLSALQDERRRDAWTAYTDWWNGIAKQGDPMRRPNLAREAFIAGWSQRAALEAAPSLPHEPPFPQRGETWEAPNGERYEIKGVLHYNAALEGTDRTIVHADIYRMKETWKRVNPASVPEALSAQKDEIWPDWLKFPCPVCKAKSEQPCKLGASCMERVLLVSKPQPDEHIVHALVHLGKHTEGANRAHVEVISCRLGLGHVLDLEKDKPQPEHTFRNAAPQPASQLSDEERVRRAIPDVMQSTKKHCSFEQAKAYLHNAPDAEVWKELCEDPRVVAYEQSLAEGKEKK